MTRHKARQLAYSIAASLVQAEMDNPSDIVYGVLATNGHDDSDDAKVTAELADIAQRLAYFGRKVKS